MIRDLRRGEITDFLSQVVNMTVADFESIEEFFLAHYDGLEKIMVKLKMGAADYSWLRKRVNDVVRVLLTELEWPSLSLEVMLDPHTISAAQASWCRDRLSMDEYEALVGGFRQMGVVVPPHLSEIGSDGSAGAV